MNLMATPRRRFGAKAVPAREGFTLVEMLVVLAIMAILAVLALPSVKGVLGSMDLKGGANLVTAQLDLARQTLAPGNLQVGGAHSIRANVTDPHCECGQHGWRDGVPDHRGCDSFLQPRDDQR